MFEEAMEVIKLAWTQERFSYTGKHYSFPPVGIPDRGSLVTELTLVPRPTREIEIYQPITSPDTMTYAPAVKGTRASTGSSRRRRSSASGTTMRRSRLRPAARSLRVRIARSC